MADHTQLNSGDATLRDTIHNEPLALDPELVADVLNPGLFVDVNDQEAEYQRLYAGQPETAFIPNGLEIPRPNLPALFDGASTSAISTEALRTPEPEHNEDNLRAGDAHDQNATHNRYRDVNFEEFINFAACEPADTVETEPPMPNPTILHQYHSEPTVSMTVKPLPFTRSSTSAGALLESPTEPHDGLHRSISKRGRQDTSNDPASPIKKPIGKRLKKQKDGYPCKGCTEIFDRDCDRTKHFERNHKPKDQHPYACPHCKANGIVKAFQYPKDLRRHFKQVHNIVTPSVSPDRKPPNTSPVSETASKPSVLRALSNAVMSLKKLRITATSPQHNLIMVSKDQKSFFEVEVSGLNFAADLVSRILDTLGLDKNFPLQGVQAQAYSREYGRVKLGQKLDAQNIFKLVNKNADGQGSLKLLISTADGYHT